jgi:hypothetical protein
MVRRKKEVDVKQRGSGEVSAELPTCELCPIYTPTTEVDRIGNIAKPGNSFYSELLIDRKLLDSGTMQHFPLDIEDGGVLTVVSMLWTSSAGRKVIFVEQDMRCRYFGMNPKR